MKLPEMQSFLFVGLGNPGPQYIMTRHNIGFMVIEALVRQMQGSFKEDKHFQALVGKETRRELTIHFLLPLTYMNLSGIAVKRYADYFKIPLSHIVIVADDVALPYGQLRLKTMGSAGGHNGLKSIETHLGTSHYIRLRMGIGHPGQKVLTDYVLDAFDSDEKEMLPAFIDCGVKVLKRLLEESPSQVMNAVNTVQRRASKKEPGQEPTDLTKPIIG